MASSDSPSPPPPPLIFARKSQPKPCPMEVDDQGDTQHQVPYNGNQSSTSSNQQIEKEETESFNKILSTGLMAKLKSNLNPKESNKLKDLKTKFEQALGFKLNVNLEANGEGKTKNDEDNGHGIDCLKKPDAPKVIRKCKYVCSKCPKAFPNQVTLDIHQSNFHVLNDGNSNKLPQKINKGMDSNLRKSFSGVSGSNESWTDSDSGLPIKKRGRPPKSLPNEFEEPMDIESNSKEKKNFSTPDIESAPVSQRSQRKRNPPKWTENMVMNYETTSYSFSPRVAALRKSLGESEGPISSTEKKSIETKSKQPTLKDKDPLTSKPGKSAPPKKIEKDVEKNHITPNQMKSSDTQESKLAVLLKRQPTPTSNGLHKSTKNETIMSNLKPVVQLEMYNSVSKDMGNKSVTVSEKTGTEIESIQLESEPEDSIEVGNDIQCTDSTNYSNSNDKIMVEERKKSSVRNNFSSDMVQDVNQSTSNNVEFVKATAVDMTAPTISPYYNLTITVEGTTSQDKPATTETKAKSTVSQDKFATKTKHTIPQGKSTTMAESNISSHKSEAVIDLTISEDKFLTKAEPTIPQDKSETETEEPTIPQNVSAKAAPGPDAPENKPKTNNSTNSPVIATTSRPSRQRVPAISIKGTSSQLKNSPNPSKVSNTVATTKTGNTNSPTSKIEKEQMKNGPKARITRSDTTINNELKLEPRVSTPVISHYSTRNRNKVGKIQAQQSREDDTIAGTPLSQQPAKLEIKNTSTITRKESPLISVDVSKPNTRKRKVSDLEAAEKIIIIRPPSLQQSVQSHQNNELSSSPKRLRPSSELIKPKPASFQDLINTAVNENINENVTENENQSASNENNSLNQIGTNFLGMPKLLNQSGVTVPDFIGNDETDSSDSDDDPDYANLNIHSPSNSKGNCSDTYIKDVAIRFLANKISNRNMLRIRQELMTLKQSGNYFKLTKTAPLAAGLVHDMFCQILEPSTSPKGNTTDKDN